MRKSRINPVADPVLKNRLIIANDPQFSIKKWGMMIVTMAIIIGVFLLGYSFPHFFDVFIGSDQPTKEASTAPGTNTVVTTLSTPLPISATIASPQSSATTAVRNRTNGTATESKTGFGLQSGAHIGRHPHIDDCFSCYCTF